MADNSDHIDELFSDRFRGFEDAASAREGWDAMEAMLEEEMPQRTALGWRLWVAGLAILVSGILLIPWDTDVPQYQPVELGFNIKDQVEQPDQGRRAAIETNSISEAESPERQVANVAHQPMQKESPSQSALDEASINIQSNSGPAKKTNSIPASKAEMIDQMANRERKELGNALSRISTTERPEEVESEGLPLPPENHVNPSLLTPVIASGDNGVKLNQAADREAVDVIPAMNAIKEQIIIYGGAHYGQVFTTDGLGTQRMEPIVGFTYRKWFGAKWSLGISGQYISKQGHQLEHFSEKVSFFLERQVETNAIQTNVLRYFQFPVHWNYQFTPRHRLGIGGYVAALITSTGTWRRSFQDSEGITTQNLGSVEGYYQGIESLDFGASVAYNFRLSGKLSIGLRYLYGLEDVTKDEVYRQQYDHFTRDLQAVMNYHLINYK